jgi:UDP-N-acetylmuramoyl-tripeptide--D-alanyl-D-alanine ligase
MSPWRATHCAGAGAHDELAEAAAVLGAMRGGDARFSACIHDSRTLRRGELFVALRGERFDGPRLSPERRGRESGRALVRFEVRRRPAAAAAVVDDTRLALGVLARHWRARFRPRSSRCTGRTARPR